MIVRCVGINDNDVNPIAFKQMFVMECQSVGRIIKILEVNNVLLAEVENGN